MSWPVGAPISITLSATIILFLGVVLLLAGSMIGWGRLGIWDLNIGMALGAGLLLLSDVPLRAQSFGQSKIFPLEVIVLGAACTALIASRPRIFPPLFCFAALLVALTGFFLTSDGRLLFSDDHPAFLYRLIQLKEHFPHIPFYNAEWNGGVEAREFFPSGALAPFFVAWPIIEFTKLESSYNFIVAYLVFILPAVSLFASAILFGFGTQSAFLAAGLSLGTSLLWYRWALSFGTLGFITAAALAPLLIALIDRAVRPESRWNLGLTLLFVSLAVVVPRWPPMTLAFLPAALLLLFKLKAVFSRKQVLIAILCTLFLNAPLFAIFVKTSNVSRFVTEQFVDRSDDASEDRQESDPGVKEISDPGKAKPIQRELRERGSPARAVLRQYFLSANPLILLGAIAAIVLPAPLLIRITMGWLLLFGSLGMELIPRIEPERMLLLFGLLAVLPLSKYLHSFFDSVASGRKLSRLAACTVLSGLTAYVPLWLWRVCRNETVERYHFAEPVVAKLTEGLRKYGGEGRILFAGFILHELSQGHVAPLPHWVGKPMIASRYQHDRWEYTDVIPEEFRKRGEEGVLEFLDLMNVSAVVAHDRFWKNWYRARPSLFEEVWKSSQFVVFKRRGFQSSYALSGTVSSLKQLPGGLSLVVEKGPTVLKFQYYPFLTAAGCEVVPHSVSQDLTLVELRNCPSDREVVLAAKDPLERLLPD